jgi:hypothetical protein
MGSGVKSHRLMAAIDRVIDQHGGWRWNLQLREGHRQPIRSPPQQMLLELCSVLGLSLTERETSQGTRIW